VTSNFSDQRAVSDNIAALTINIKRPKVRIETGKVKTLISEPKIELIKPKSRATQRYVVKLPLTVIPGTASVAIHIANARTAQRIIKFIT
jgi:PBP1b-binding outer membrane lipoprotein LpoB